MPLVKPPVFTMHLVCTLLIYRFSVYFYEETRDLLSFRICGKPVNKGNIRNFGGVGGPKLAAVQGSRKTTTKIAKLLHLFLAWSSPTATAFGSHFLFLVDISAPKKNI